MSSEPRFQVIRLSDLQEYETDPADYIAGDGFLKREAGCLLAGPTGIGKSVLAAQVSVCVASGNPILGGIAVPSPRKVVHIQAENDRGDLKQHVLGIIDGVRAKETLVEENLLIYHVFGLTGHAFMAELARIVERDSPDLVIVDPFQSYIQPGDLNNSAPMLEWIQGIDGIIKPAGCAIMVVAHTTKHPPGNSTPPTDMVYASAGNAGLANWTRTSFELTSLKGNGQARLTFGKNPQRAGLTDASGRSLQEVGLIRGVDESRPYWTVSDVEPKAPNAGKYDSMISELVATNPELTNASIGVKVGCHKTTVGRRRDIMNI